MKHRLIKCKPLRLVLLSSLLSLVIFNASIAGFARVQTFSGLFDVYQDNREKGIPNYITADLLLVSYSLLRQRNNTSFEENVLTPMFSEWLGALQAAIPDDNEKASIANHRLVQVLTALLEGAEPPSDKLALSEYELIVQASDIANSPLLYRSMDYGRFEPAGRYAESDAASRYYQAFRYANAVLFPLLESKATGINAKQADLLFMQAKQIAGLMVKNKPLQDAYNKLTDTLKMRFGDQEDLDWALLQAQKETSNKLVKTRKALFVEVQDEKSTPVVISEIVDATRLNKNQHPADVITGWRLLPSFATPVSQGFQRLLYTNTQKFIGDEAQNPFTLGVVAGKNVKAFPTAQEILALLGDLDSFAQLKERGETEYEGYSEAFKQARLDLASASGLAQQNLAMIQLLASEYSAPKSALSFWTWQRYIDQLYIKQTTTPMGKGLLAAEERKGASLQNASSVYRMLTELVAVEFALNPDPSWARFADVLQEIQAVQWKNTIGVELSTFDERLLNELDLSLLDITGRVDEPIAVAVHTNPSSRERLWQGVGYARLSHEGKARGARLSHHEFKAPMSEEVTNTSWLKSTKR